MISDYDYVSVPKGNYLDVIRGINESHICTYIVIYYARIRLTFTCLFCQNVQNSRCLCFDVGLSVWISRFQYQIISFEYLLSFPILRHLVALVNSMVGYMCIAFLVLNTEIRRQMHTMSPALDIFCIRYENRQPTAYEFYLRFALSKRCTYAIQFSRSGNEQSREMNLAKKEWKRNGRQRLLFVSSPSGDSLDR